MFQCNTQAMVCEIKMLRISGRRRVNNNNNNLYCYKYLVNLVSIAKKFELNIFRDFMRLMFLLE